MTHPPSRKRHWLWGLARPLVCGMLPSSQPSDPSKLQFDEQGDTTCSQVWPPESRDVPAHSRSLVTKYPSLHLRLDRRFQLPLRTGSKPGSPCITDWTRPPSPAFCTRIGPKAAGCSLHSPQPGGPGLPVSAVVEVARGWLGFLPHTILIWPL